uniref:JmjC domain-containing protein n=1 Tax=Arcella intermedia TaxID=1963864 RepID=A0A6B2LAT7_9EUKA
MYQERTLFESLRSGPASCGSSGIDYVDVRTVPLEDFKNQYVLNGGRPAMLQGVIEDGDWPAAHKWSSVEAFLRHYGEIPLKVMEKRPEHGMGRPFLVRIPFLLYKEYSEHQNADDPFYAFEPDLIENRTVFLSDYKQPRYFQQDLYNLDEQTREFYPNYKHLIIGCERTGTNLHVDPKCTGAWNTLLVGHKKWAMFPPGTDERYLEELGTKAYSKTPATYWWQDIAPKLRKDIGMVEVVQKPGETIFVPSGWWHCVLNLDFTIAITENFLVPETLGDVWVDLSTGWPKFAEYLEEKYPHLVGSLPKEQPKHKIITSALTY